MLDSELNSHDSDNNEGNGRARSEPETASAPAAPTAPAAPVTPPPEVPTPPAAPAAPAALFQAPQVHFQPPAPTAAAAAGGRDTGDRDLTDGGDGGESGAGGNSEAGRTGRRTARGGRGARSARGGSAAGGGADAQDDDLFSADRPADGAEAADSVASGDAAVTAGDESDGGPAGRRRRRRTGRSRGRAETAAAEASDADGTAAPDKATGASEPDSDTASETAEDEDAESAETAAAGRRRRRKRRRGSADTDVTSPDDPPDTVVHVREPHGQADDVRPIKGSTRLEAKKQRRREGRESGRRRPPVVTESEFLARRESVERTMIVRQRGDRTQIAVLEDGVLVEHYVNRTTHQSYVGNVYLGKVQNVLPSMEAAFVDIGKGRNAVLYAGEVNFDASTLEGQPKRIESALKSGQSVIVQVTKDPVGHKGARLTSQISLPGRYLVYVPGASMTGISRKLPDTERNRLKHILKKVTPENAGVIVRTAAEGAAEAELDRDVTRLAAQWENIEQKSKTASAPALLYGEPDLTIRVIRDVFNEDFSKLIVSGEDEWDIIDEYVRYVAPHLADRLTRWEDAPDREEDDVFAAYRIDEQLTKALERKVWLPSGGSLVIDRTEAMTVIDVNTGKFTGQGGNLEETVTRNNLEAAEEIVRQLRLRDVGGIVVIDFIDMVLESNRELVLRRLLECLARDRTKHQVAEVTSLGLVQMTRKRVGAGLLEAFSQQCECCNGRGVIITLEQPEPSHRPTSGHTRRPALGNGSARNGSAGNGGHAARTGEDRPARPGQDRDTPDRAAQDGPSQDGPAQDSPARDRSGRDEPGHRGRRGRRDGRGAAGTAAAPPAEVADAAPVASPVVVADEAPPVASPVLSDTAAATDASVPVRRTRAGSALARVTVTSDEPIAVVPPAADALPAQDVTPAPDATPAQDVTPAQEAEPAGDTAPGEVGPTAEDAAAAEDAATRMAALVADSAPVEDASAAEVVAPVGTLAGANGEVAGESVPPIQAHADGEPAQSEAAPSEAAHSAEDGGVPLE